MQLPLTIILIVASIYADTVDAASSGAPSAACDTLSPNPTAHGALPQSSVVPYSIDLSPFADGTGNYYYTPGETYTLTISGNDGETFRGFFVQCRLMADDNTRVGTFTATQANTRLSSCTPATDGVTHDNPNLIDFTYREFQWTAPAAGTGDVRFGFAVVQVRVTYWANERSAVIQEAVASGSGSGDGCGGACVYNAICYDGYCQCDYGFSGYGYQYCYDINECYYYGYCSEYADCYNTYGSFYCVCREGYTGDGYTCEAVGSGSGACGGDCVDYAYCYDGYCQCDDGFTGNGYDYCEDINECEYYDYEETCGYAECYNTYGSYECICDDGYYYSYAVTDCVPLEGLYRHRPIVHDGCDPERNAYYRYEIQYKVQEFLSEYYSYRYGYKK